MRVESLCAVAVLNDDIISVSAVPAIVTTDNDIAGSRGKDRGAGVRSEVNAIVPMEALRQDAVNRSDVVTAVFRSACSP